MEVYKYKVTTADGYTLGEGLVKAESKEAAQELLDGFNEGTKFEVKISEIEFDKNGICSF
jgi:hypothetical protein